jgi:hypothetical protein
VHHAGEHPLVKLERALNEFRNTRGPSAAAEPWARRFLIVMIRARVRHAVAAMKDSRMVWNSYREGSFHCNHVS